MLIVSGAELISYAVQPTVVSARMINYFYFSTVNSSLTIHAASQQGLDVSVRSAGGSLFTPLLCVGFSLLRRCSVTAKHTDGNQRVPAWL